MAILGLEGLAAPLTFSAVVLPCVRASGLVAENPVDSQHFAACTHGSILLGFGHASAGTRTRQRVRLYLHTGNSQARAAEGRLVRLDCLSVSLLDFSQKRMLLNAPVPLRSVR